MERNMLFELIDRRLIAVVAVCCSVKILIRGGQAGKI